MTPNILNVISKSSGVFEVHCMDMKLGGWGRYLMPTILKVTSRSLSHQGPSKVKWVNIGVWT